VSVYFGTRRRALRAAAATIGSSALLVLAACSSTSNSDGGGSTSATIDSNVISQAQSLLKQFSARPIHIPVTTPVGKPIPTGKTIDWVVCGSPDCTIWEPDMEAAAAVLGWHLKVINGGLTPQTVLAAWNLAVENHPDGILANAFPEVMFAKPLAQAKAEGIPVVDAFVDDPVGNGISAVVPDAEGTYKAQGQAWAAADLAKLGKSADTLVLSSTAYQAAVEAQKYFKHYYSQMCPSCGYDAINVPPTAIGTTLPGNVVAFMHSHPQINAIIAIQGDMTVGLPQTLKTAGLHAAIFTAYPNATLLQYLQDGSIDAIEMYEQNDTTWRMMDVMARILAGVSPAPDEVPSKIWLITNAADAANVAPHYYQIPGFKAQYEKLWGKS
jgi:ribose transport system substrate-binding protein